MRYETGFGQAFQVVRELFIVTLWIEIVGMVGDVAPVEAVLGDTR